LQKLFAGSNQVAQRCLDSEGLFQRPLDDSVRFDSLCLSWVIEKVFRQIPNRLMVFLGENNAVGFYRLSSLHELNMLAKYVKIGDGTAEIQYLLADILGYRILREFAHAATPIALLPTTAWYRVRT